MRHERSDKPEKAAESSNGLVCDQEKRGNKPKKRQSHPMSLGCFEDKIREARNSKKRQINPTSLVCLEEKRETRKARESSDELGESPRKEKRECQKRQSSD